MLNTVWTGLTWIIGMLNESYWWTWEQYSRLISAPWIYVSCPLWISQMEMKVGAEKFLKFLSQNESVHHV